MAKKESPPPDTAASVPTPDAPKAARTRKNQSIEDGRRRSGSGRVPARTASGEPTLAHDQAKLRVPDEMPVTEKTRPKNKSRGIARDPSLWTRPLTGPESQADQETLHMLHAMAGHGMHIEPAPGPRLLPPLQNPASPPDTLPPVTEVRRFNTVRLIPAKYSESVLTRIADSDEDLELLFGLESATNDRLLAEANLRLGVNARELVYGVPNARIVNAAFTHPHPQGGRFSLPYRGCWYAAFEVATARAEVMFHRNLQFAEIGWDKPEEMDYDQYLADFSGGFHDLRAPETLADPRFGSCLDPDSYIRSQQLTLEMLETGSPGVLYPSTRRRGGQCIACFRPSMVANVRKRDTYRLTWFPDRAATFSRLAKPQLASAKETSEPEGA